ncbi:DUF305 domain-containing protein [Hyphobacterium marinum]|uniref:DUF305 domain-containing protein n=1 Tax=Hyphobacterium marinum TaxID=3116574 RepID=A0ABU7M1M7_9PROT|nr:DUF305 domain-containing protein [Hyphobacterium sp. Y6023]MEE2567728.1 DUF305 domain-containing protein [Hyphobacterium sp. Y6023]
MWSRASLRVQLIQGASVLALAVAGQAGAQDAPIVQPGAPGQQSRTLTAEDAVRVAENRYSADDVRFMQDMILHHYQAVQMSALVPDRTNHPDVLTAAGRIDASQEDEIAFMQSWLTERGRDAPDPANDPHAMHGGHGMMEGMATPEQMAELATLEGPAFDRMFLELMIAHHEGAVEMVDHLFDQSGSAYDPVLYEFASDVKNEQQAEIRRMGAIIRTLWDDPRSTLSPGFRDAGEAISNLEHVATLPKPTGFFDVENPAGLPPLIEDEDEDSDEAPENEAADGDDRPRFGQRSPFLSFSNTDMAFSGDLMAAGNYHGFNLYRLGEDPVPQLISSVVCPGGQGDVSISGNLLLMSVEQTRGRVDCGLEGVGRDASPDRFRGLRIFDISDPRAPVQVGQVQTCRGSHTHSIVSGPDEDGILVVYNSGTASVRDEEELVGCVDDDLGDERTALFRIDVIEIPVADPSQARIVHSPTVFADEETGAIAGLWTGGDHGDGTQTTSRTDECHDITVFPSANLAAGACSGNGIIFDITDPRDPRRIDAVSDDGFAYWHSATFNNDGTRVLFTDEWGGGGRPRCLAQDPRNWGANAFYDIVDGQLEFRGYYKLPAAQTDTENCVAHNGSIIPVPGRDIFAQAWYQGGLSVIDFTDPSNVVEIAYFDRGPISADVLTTGGYWSSYWYDGRIYATEISRGLDVFELVPSNFLTENEIAAAGLADQGGTFNPQTQHPVSWPAHPAVARAYIDQLRRDDAMPEAMADSLLEALATAEDHIASGTSDPALAGMLAGIATGLPAEGSGQAAMRARSLRDTLTGIADRLQ